MQNITPSRRTLFQIKFNGLRPIGSCWIRVTTQGNVKTCLYAQPSLNLKLLLRTGYTDEQIKVELIKAVIDRYEDGILAEQQNGQKVHNSMSAIGG